MNVTLSLPGDAPRPTVAGMMRLTLSVIVLGLVSIAALLGGMAYLMIVMAIGLSVYVWKRPNEAPGAAMLFLFAAGILLPYSARFLSESDDMSQMYYWAAGLLLITVAAVMRIGVKRVFNVPRSAQAFFLVAIAASLYGFTQGATVSYALRQFYGVLVLIVYLGIAYHVGDALLLTRRIATYGVLCAFAFFVYYVAVFSEYGFHKEMGYTGTQASFLAIALFLPSVGRRMYTRAAGAMCIMGVPILLFARKDVLTYLLAIPVALAINLKSKTLRILCGCVIGLIALPALFPPIADMVGEQMTNLPMVGELIPHGAQGAESLYERVIQADVALSTVQSHPLLGEGFGGVFQWDSPYQGFLQSGYIDNGWAYLLQKMGLLGAAAFLWFLVTVFAAVSRKSIGLGACLISAALVTMFSEPVFFHFTLAPFLGSYAGLIVAGKRAALSASTYVS